MVVKEAVACGIPTIGTLHGGIPEIIENERTGFLVEERDSDALCDRLVRLLDDENLRRELGRAARKKMVEKYDIHQQVRALEEIYDSVIDDFAAKGSSAR